MIRLSCVLGIIMCAFFVHGQTDKTVNADSTTYNAKDDFSLSAFPLVFYLPETSLAFGGAGISVFNIGKEKTWRKSQVQIGLAYSLKKQILIFLPFELHFKQNWRLHGELGYYRYFYNYYGIGVASKQADLETYDANFPRLLGTWSYRFREKFFAGVQYRFDHFDIPRTDSLLQANNPIGINGGTVSSIGLALAYDTRNDIFYPSKGINANVIIETSGNTTLADFDYQLLQFDFSYYQRIKKQHLFATNLFIGTTIGDSPFFTYYYLSSGKRGRGFNDRRFIDRNMALLQTEYRFPIYKRFKGAAFASVGTLSNAFNDLWGNKKMWSYGAGLRFQLSKKQLSNIRLDVAHSAEGFQFYITIGEAF